MYYDLCIIGAGMIGSSAARHATLSSDNKVCLIGPSEPKERSRNADRDIYGSYYDEGRITLSWESDPMCRSKLATESIKRYKEIEELSGIKFYDELGCLSVGDGAATRVATSQNLSGETSKVKPELLTYQLVEERFSYLKLPVDVRGIVETKNAGVINPRKLVQAQQKLALRQGCTIIDDVVCDVDRIVYNNQTYVMKVMTETGKTILTKKVLLCTGAFTRLRNLLPRNLSIQHTIAPLTVALIEVDMTSSATQALRDMPCVIYYGQRHKDWIIPDVIHKNDDIDFYMLPPIQYPDGRFYIKLGITNKRRPNLYTSSDVKTWFDEGNPSYQESTAKFTKSLSNGIPFKSWLGDSCAIMNTPSYRPYIDKIHDQLGVVVGCNGHGAKSCDEIGRLGATMMLQGWSSDIPQHCFKLKFDNKSKL